MGRRIGVGAVFAVALFGLGLMSVAPGPGPVELAAQVPPDPAAAVIAQYRQRIPELMEEQGVPGLAVAVVDGDRPLWVEGFGSRDRRGDARVTADTMFGVQSISKLFTATAVLRAVQAGHVELDEPITAYLPEFTVHSAFEARPERRITLRMLLAHTAGFTHEAPVGNNNELDPGDFDVHVRSIADTWLRFPVGTGYAYSNLGIDLAGYILERVEGKPFAEIMRDSLLAPLGMRRSTFDRTAIRAAADRALGHVDPFPEPPVDVPMTAAGGLYASAADLARFLRFQLRDGSIDGRVVLDPTLMDVQRRVVAPRPGEPSGAALGVFRTRWNRWDQRPDLFNHGGGGYGFLSDLWWLPQVRVGIAVVTNSQDHDLQADLALSILGDLLSEPGEYQDRLLALPDRPPVVDPTSSYAPPAGMSDLVADAGMTATGDEATRWAAYAGEYRIPVWRVIPPLGRPQRFLVDSGVPYFETDDDGDGLFVRHRLVEVEPGLFLAGNGETLDLRGQVPTWRNFVLTRVTNGPAVGEWVILGAVAILAAAWLVAATIRTVRRRSSLASIQRLTTARTCRRLAGVLATFTAVLAVGTVGLVTAVPGLVDSGFLGWLESPTAQRIAFHLPLILAFLSACTVVLTIAGWAGRWWSRAVGLQYVALAVASVVLVARVAAWQLIGWGMS